MSPRWMILVLALALVSGAYLCNAAGSSGPEAHAAVLDAELEKHMDEIDSIIRKMKTRVTAEKIDDPRLTSEMIIDLQGHIVASKKFVPGKIKKLPDNDRAAAYLGYKKTLNELLGAALELEAAVLDEKPADGAAAVQKMLGMKKPAHDKYK